MMTYFREGGFNMWLLLAAALVTLALAATQPRKARPAIFVAGLLFSLTSGIFGMATGMLMVAKHCTDPRHPELIAVGLGELSHNGTFAALLATLQGVLALVAARAAAREA